MTEFHPAPIEFTAEQIAADAMLRFFHYGHLPSALQAASRPFCALARHIVEALQRGTDRRAAQAAGSQGCGRPGAGGLIMGKRRG